MNNDAVCKNFLDNLHNEFLNEISIQYNISFDDLCKNNDNKKKLENIEKINNQCCGRIFAKGFGARCKDSIIKGTDYCSLHLKEHSSEKGLKYNRYDEYPPQKNKKMYQTYLECLKKNTVKSDFDKDYSNKTNKNISGIESDNDNSCNNSCNDSDDNSCNDSDDDNSCNDSR